MMPAADKRSAAATLMFMVCALCAFLAGGSIPAAGANKIEQAEIGTTVVIRRRVTGTLGDSKRRLRRGVRVFRNEMLETSARSRLELKLDDDTKLALGPSARLYLDDYVVGTSDGVTKITLKFLKGAFRFITGQNKSEVYEIETPSATIGVRGTVFDVFISKKGDTVVLLHEGEVEICSRARRCRRHNVVGRIVHAALTGFVSEPLKWTGKLIPGVSVTRAFPFVGRRLIIDPIRRLKHAAIVDRPVKGARRVLRKGGRAVERGTRSLGRAIRKISPF